MGSAFSSLDGHAGPFDVRLLVLVYDHALRARALHRDGPTPDDLLAGFSSGRLPAFILEHRWNFAGV